MRFLKVLVFTVVLAVLFSCTKKVATYEQTIENGIKITKNTGVPADSTFKIELKEVGFIDNENETDSSKYLSSADYFDYDEHGNLYILDQSKNKINKYDKDCKFLLSFGRDGAGPGEFHFPGYFNIRKDTLFLSNWTSLKIIKFDLNGNYLSDKVITDLYKFPAYPKKFGSNYIYKATTNKFDSEGKMFFVDEVTLYNEKFDFVKYFSMIEYESKENVDHDPTEFGTKVAFSDSILYLYKNSKDVYKIDVLNNEGIKIREIRKNFIRTKASEKDILKYEEFNKKRGTKYKREFKNSISNLYVDKYGRLWVASIDNSEDNLCFDIFKDDIFINKVLLDIDKGWSYDFVADKIISVNSENNNIKIYEY
ncbi:MAG TPA: hypothetical protein PLK90_02305 [Clostridiales bacterium]|nr:hypothetical protein [Clostridiales bacterium]HQP69209.1 hypothetical protein [Clostridiales bacterium]